MNPPWHVRAARRLYILFFYGFAEGTLLVGALFSVSWALNGLSAMTAFYIGNLCTGYLSSRVARLTTMMRDRPLLLVLDEPTASLDAPTEAALFERYAGASRRGARRSGAVTLFVSHRFSTVRAADLIVVLHDGRVVEVGSHDDLIARDGRYAELFELQARAYR